VIVALLGDPVSASLSPMMQNAAFAARGLDWTYVALRVRAGDLEDALRGLVALGFAGANVTTPHKRAVAQLVGSDLESVNTLVVATAKSRPSTDAAILDGLELEPRGDPRRRWRGGGVRGCAAGGGALLAARKLAARRRRRRPRRQRDSERDEVLVELDPGQTLIDLRTRPRDGT
jgi:hypothetical protein